MRRLLATERPHLIGTLEGQAGQLADIESDLGDRYHRIGGGRRGGTNDEFMAIFYDTTRLTLLEQDHYWLSDTPELVGSNTWGGRWIRMVTWARFRDRTTGGHLYAVNTHLDSVSAYARERSAHLIRDRLAALDPTVPVVLTGDFNSAPRADNPVYEVLTGEAGLVDTWPAAAMTGPVYGTTHGFQPLRAGGTRIDWILTSPGVRVAAAAINTYAAPSGQYPSDHLPVQVRLRLPVAKGAGAALDD
jgi:endonuclease/exonuclease/phosphatase family metal-dependent hydrolase